MVTSSVAMRGIVTAIRWFLPKTHQVKTYATGDLERALVDMGLAPEERAEITRAVKAHLKTLADPSSHLEAAVAPPKP